MDDLVGARVWAWSSSVSVLHVESYKKHSLYEDRASHGAKVASFLEGGAAGKGLVREVGIRALTPLLLPVLCCDRLPTAVFTWSFENFCRYFGPL